MVEEQVRGISPDTPEKRTSESVVEHSGAEHALKRLKVDQLATPPIEKVLDFHPQLKDKSAKGLSKEEAKAAKEAAKEAAKAAKEAARAEKEKQRELKKQQKEEELRIKREKREEELRIRREKKEEEKRLKEEERARKQTEMEERKKAREEAKRLKEEERLEAKRKKEEERLQKEAEKKAAEEEKERLRKLEEEKKAKHSITAFFKKAPSSPAPEATRAAQAVKAVKTENPAQSSPIKQSNLLQAAIASSEPVVHENSGAVPSSPAPKKSLGAPFESHFLPFYANANTTVSHHTPPRSQFKDLDALLSSPTRASGAGFKTFLRGYRGYKPRDDLTTASDVAQKVNLGLGEESEKLFDRVPQKYLEFYENKRPPYLGTYSFSVKDVEEDLPRDPFARVTSKGKLAIDYDYDSDLEDIEDDEEGEDLGEDDEDDEDDENASSSDLEGFVEEDDGTNGNSGAKDEAAATGGKITSQLRPECRWYVKDDSDKDAFTEYFNGLGYKRLRYEIGFPIDPVHNYWKPEKPEVKAEVSVDVTSSAAPPASASGAGVTATTGASKKVITSPADMATLRAFIKENEDFTLGTLTEMAQKKVLNGYSKAMVRNSIKELAKFDKKRNVWELTTATPDTPATTAAPVAPATVAPAVAPAVTAATATSPSQTSIQSTS